MKTRAGRLRITASIGRMAWGVAGFGCVFLTPRASAADCGPVDDDARAVWREWSATAGAKSLSADASSYNEAYQKMVQRMDAGRLRLGSTAPLPLNGEAVTGKLEAGARRAYITLAPAYLEGVILHIAKQDGGGGADIRVCAVAENNNPRPIWELPLGEGSDLGLWSRSLYGVRDQLVTVLVDNRSRSGAFEYELSLQVTAIPVPPGRPGLGPTSVWGGGAGTSPAGAAQGGAASGGAGTTGAGQNGSGSTGAAAGGQGRSSSQPSSGAPAGAGAPPPRAP